MSSDITLARKVTTYWATCLRQSGTRMTFSFMSCLRVQHIVVCRDLATDVRVCQRHLKW